MSHCEMFSLAILKTSCSTWNCKQNTTQTACTDAQSVSQHILNRMITFHHTNTRGSRLHIFVSQNGCHPRVMSRSLPHLTLTTSTSSLSSTSPTFPTFSPSHPSPLAHDPYFSCEDSWQSGRSTQIPSLTGTVCSCIMVVELFRRFFSCHLYVLRL